MEETKMPESAEMVDQLGQELQHQQTMNEAAMALSPKELKSIQRAARRMGRKQMVSQATFTRTQPNKEKAKNIRKMQKLARKKNR